MMRIVYIDQLKLFVALGFLIGMTILSPPSSADSLPDWMQPGVRAGAGSLKKRLFLSAENIGTVTDIERGVLLSKGTIEFGIAGNYGARFFDEAGNPQGALNFPVRPLNGAKTLPRIPAKIVRQPGKPGVLFFLQGEAIAAYDSLVDFSGKEIWRTPYAPVASAFGELKMDGGLEFIFAGQDSVIEARDISGSVIWRADKIGWADRLDLIDPSDGAKPELIAAVNGSLVGLGSGGEVLFKRKPAVNFYFSDFSTTGWSGICEGQCLLISANDRFLLLTPDGEKVVTELHSTSYLMNARAIPVRLIANQPPLLAVAGLLPYKGKVWPGFEAVHGVLYLFDSNENLVYQEVLSEPIEALDVSPTSDGKREALLVGGENKVWEYSYSSLEGK